MKKKLPIEEDELRPHYDLKSLHVRRVGPKHKRFGGVAVKAEEGQKPIMTYLVNLTFDPEYRGYVADVPALPGCMSQGRTVEKALENVKDAIRAYREAEGGSKSPALRMVLSAQVEV